MVSQIKVKGRPRIGAELKKPNCYSYDYPSNREIAKNLGQEDKKIIAQETGFSLKYIYQWCQGKRRSTKIEALAKQISKFNIAKLKIISSPK